MERLEVGDGWIQIDESSWRTWRIDGLRPAVETDHLNGSSTPLVTAVCGGHEYPLTLWRGQPVNIYGREDTYEIAREAAEFVLAMVRQAEARAGR